MRQKIGEMGHLVTKFPFQGGCRMCRQEKWRDGVSGQQTTFYGVYINTGGGSAIIVCQL